MTSRKLIDMEEKLNEGNGVKLMFAVDKIL